MYPARPRRSAAAPLPASRTGMRRTPAAPVAGRVRMTVTLLSAAALASCSLAPPDLRPAMPVPPSWPVGDAYLRQSESVLPTVRYTDVFRDLRLQRIIEQALANNRDLRIAAANIAAARAQFRIQRAELFPELDANAGASYSHSATNTVPNGVGGTITTGGGQSSFSAGLAVPTYELDLFGRIRSLTRAAQDRYFAQEAAARATRLTLVGNVATAWATYAADRSLLRIARDTVISAERSVILTRARLNGGIAPRTDLRQAEIIRDTARSDLAAQTTAVAQDANALQLLVGAPVDSALLPAGIEEVLPTIAMLPAGLDSQVLLRRPDVVQAEYNLRAYNAEIGEARAELFPRITLTGMASFASSALTSLFAGRNFSYSGSAGANYPIFRAGAGRANVRYSEAQRDSALASYEQAIQTAFRDVADALARQGTITAQLAAQRDLVAASLDNYRLSDARYRGGIDTFLQSLDAQRSLYSAQQTQVSAQLTAAANLVRLYQVIGGDSLLDATTGGPVPLGDPGPLPTVSPYPTATPTAESRLRP